MRAQQKAMPVIGDPRGRRRQKSPWLANLAVLPSARDWARPGTSRDKTSRSNTAGPNGEYDRLPALAADLVGRKVDAIAALSVPSALAAKSATWTIPIVFSIGDAVGARPGRQSRPAGGQPHGRQLPHRRTVAQAGRAAVQRPTFGAPSVPVRDPRARCRATRDPPRLMTMQEASAANWSDHCYGRRLYFARR